MSSITSTTWRVVLNPKLWNQKKFEEDWKENKVIRIPQSKGKCIMRNTPQKNDNVFFVIKGKIRMKGIVKINGFIKGINHQEDKYNNGNVRNHAEVEEFTWIDIIEVELDEPIRHMGQRTWVKIT